MLHHNVVEGLVFVHDFIILFGVVVPTNILLSLVGVLAISNAVLAGEGFCSLAVVETTGSINEGSQGVTALLLICIVIGEFGFTDSSVSLGVER